MERVTACGKVFASQRTEAHLGRSLAGGVLVGPISHGLHSILTLLLCLSFLSEVDKYSVYRRQHNSSLARRPIIVPSGLLLPLLSLEPDDRRGRNHPFGPEMHAHY